MRRRLARPCPDLHDPTRSPCPSLHYAPCVRYCCGAVVPTEAPNLSDKAAQIVALIERGAFQKIHNRHNRHGLDASEKAPALATRQAPVAPCVNVAVVRHAPATYDVGASLATRAWGKRCTHTVEGPPPFESGP